MHENLFPCVTETKAFFHKAALSFGRLSDTQSMSIETWVHGRHFLKNKQTQPVMPRKANDRYAVKNSREKLKLGKRPPTSINLKPLKK